MTKSQERKIHVVFWVIFISLELLYSLLFVERRSVVTNQWLTLQLIGFWTLHICIFYLNYLWICPNTVPLKNWKLFVVGEISLLLLFPFLRYIIEEVIIYSITGHHNYGDGSRNSIFYLFDNTYYSIRIILLSLVFYFMKIIWKNNQKINTLNLEMKQAELRNLKNQLSPHFLFNTLNSFYADLMDTKPTIANDILKLSDLLRYVTYENENDNVYLKEEIQFLNNYIDLFSRRLDNQLAVNFYHDEIEETKMIPALLLIHFVENALKHGITTDVTKPIEIHLTTENNRLLFVVENYYMVNERYDESGIGYKNIQQRLELLFPDNHILVVNKDSDFYKIELNIPLL